MPKKLRIDPFVLALLVSVAGAYFFPYPGSSRGPINLDLISSIGISLIFFFYGLSLNTEAIRSGLKNWRLHVIIQASTFVLFPLLVLPFYPVFKDSSQELIWLAFLFMAALPSTVSSSVVLVSMAKGNLPAAIFNASISGIIGILLTPLWMIPFIPETNIDFDFTAIYRQLITEIVVPLALGLLLRRYLGKLASIYKRQLDLFDKFIILVIVYKSFVHSFEDQIFTSVNVLTMSMIVILTIALFFLMYNLTGWIGKLLKFNYPDRITNQFCGTKKSLIHGTVFSEALFGHTSIIGILLLPLMIYHAFQILVISVYATRIREERELELAREMEA